MPGEVSANIALLKIKYSVPKLNKQLLSRPMLNDRLEDALSHKLTIITAPAGYGKTISVQQWLEKVSLPHAWLSLDTYDNDPIVFWRYFCTALESISSGISKDTKYVFASQELLKANLHINILIDSLSHISSDFVLVLDDLHLITNPTINNGLSYFISYLPSNMHLVLISRVEPHLELAKLGLNEDLVRVRANELRFGADEISQFCAARGYFLPKDDLKRIENYTEGWAAALVAVTLSLKDKKYLPNAIGSYGSCSQNIENYLSEDVFKTWTSEQQRFMEKTAILDRMCVPLCEAITGYTGSGLLKELYDQNSFLVALDEEGIWFKYHHLFSDFLRKKLQKKDIGLTRDLYHKAGKWFENNGLYEEAIELFLRGNLYEEVLPPIENYGGILIRKGEYSHVISWIDRLPDKYTGNSPMIMVYKAAFYTKTKDFQQAWDCLNYLELTLKEGPAVNNNLYAAYKMTEANLFLLQGDIKRALTAMTEAASFGVNNLMNRNYMEINLCDISLYRTEYCLIINMLRKNSTEYDLFSKNYRNLITTYPGYSPLFKGEFYYESGQFEEAIPELTASVDEAMNANCPGALVPAMVTMAKIKRAQEDISGALDIIEECEKMVVKYHKPHWSYILKAFKIRLSMDTDNSEMLDLWMTESKLSLYQDISRTHEFGLIVFARILIKKRSFHDANILLIRLLSFAERLKRFHSIVEITNLLAITAKEKKNEEIAVKYLEKALLIGIEQGYVRSFVDELSPMVFLLELFIKKHNKTDKLAAYAREMLIQTKEAASHSIYPSDPSSIENLLTPSEKKVLHLLIDAYSNKEIADELRVTTRTVAAHTGNIYKKLGVSSRTQCLKRIRGME